MGLKDEFADALDSIRNLRFHATRVSQGIFFLSSFLSLRNCVHVFFLRTLCGSSQRFRYGRLATPDNNNNNPFVESLIYIIA